MIFISFDLFVLQDELSKLTGNGEKNFDEDYKARLHEELLGRDTKG